MHTEVSLANTSTHIDGVFKIRHKVFSEENGYIASNNDKRILDRFDAYENTYNLAALCGDKVVGGMRVTLDSKVGLPADEFFNFRSYVPKDSYVMSIGMYCVSEAFRGSRIALDLISMAVNISLRNNVTHVFFPANPLIVKFMKKMGCEVLDDEMIGPNGLPTVPLLFNMRNISDFLLRSSKKHCQKFRGISYNPKLQSQTQESHVASLSTGLLRVA